MLRLSNPPLGVPAFHDGGDIWLEHVPYAHFRVGTRRFNTHTVAEWQTIQDKATALRRDKQ